MEVKVGGKLCSKDFCGFITRWTLGSMQEIFFVVVVVVAVVVVAVVAVVVVAVVAVVVVVRVSILVVVVVLGVVGVASVGVTSVGDERLWCKEEKVECVGVMRGEGDEGG